MVYTNSDSIGNDGIPNGERMGYIWYILNGERIGNKWYIPNDLLLHNY